MITKLLRLFKHRWQDDGLAAKAFPANVLAQVTHAVQESERQHSGEIRIYVEGGLPLSYLWRDDDLPVITRSRALSLFGKLRVWDTAHNNGVLIYLLLAERRIEMVADRGLNERVDAQAWLKIVASMQEAFSRDDFVTGLSLAVKEVHSLLLTHFPLSPGEVNPNELPDTPLLG